MPIRLTDPVTARQIAEHTAAMIADIRRSLTLGQLAQHRRDWNTYAETAGVALAIRRHVNGVANDVAVSLKAKRVVRDPTGEAA